MSTPKIIAVDFDGVLCENEYPSIGKENMLLVALLKELKSKDYIKLILWTCRVGDKLREAIQWCEEHGLIFDAVNENLPEILERFGSDNRKIYADIYVDDRAFRVQYDLSADVWGLEKEIFYG